MEFERVSLAELTQITLNIEMIYGPGIYSTRAHLRRRRLTDATAFSLPCQTATLLGHFCYMPCKQLKLSLSAHQPNSVAANVSQFFLTLNIFSTVQW